MHFGEVLEAADQLTVEEQADLVEVLRRRIVERWREELAGDIREAWREYQEGEARPSAPDELLAEILSEAEPDGLHVPSSFAF